MLIGIDFDNTIVSYDELFYRQALEAGLIDAELSRTKSAVRAQVQSRHGDLAWQRLQGQVYGPRMLDARMIEGSREFVQRCFRRGIPVRIVSHKTEYGHFDQTRTKLREVALQWLDQNGFFCPETTGLTREMVFFEATREGKLARIAELGCSHFIDDLPEVLLAEDFAAGIRRLLLAPDGENHPQLTCCRSWREIDRALFAGAADA